MPTPSPIEMQIGQVQVCYGQETLLLSHDKKCRANVRIWAAGHHYAEDAGKHLAAGKKNSQSNHNDRRVSNVGEYTI